MDKTLRVFGLGICVVFIFCSLFYITPHGRKVINNYFFTVQKVDDSTDYETIKKVEDSCRSMIASYNSDKLIYEQYKSSESSEKISWAEQAKIRANKTAITYNEYILKNSFVWKDNIPSDIYQKLEVIE